MGCGWQKAILPRDEPRREREGVLGGLEPLHRYNHCKHWLFLRSKPLQSRYKGVTGRYKLDYRLNHRWTQMDTDFERSRRIDRAGTPGEPADETSALRKLERKTLLPEGDGFAVEGEAKSSWKESGR